MQLIHNQLMQLQLSGVICLCGNDGTGKSTLVKYISEAYPEFHVIERSTKQSFQPFQALRLEIKHIDSLTYKYSFEKDRQSFEPSFKVSTSDGCIIPVHWILLDLEPQIIFQRISKRDQMGIYQSKKCVQYYSFVYLELAVYYGMTIVNVNHTLKQITDQISSMVKSGATIEIRSLSLKNLNLQMICHLDIQQQIIRKLSQEQVANIINCNWKKELNQSASENSFYQPEIQTILYQQNKVNIELGKRLAARWIISRNKVQTNQDLSINYRVQDKQETIVLKSPLFIHFIEGESKKIYSLLSKNNQVEEYFKSKIWILLKSTIYSHTNQHTGEIQDLGKIRAVGSNLFLQMLRRNNMHHAYYCVNKEGIIFSRQIETTFIEVVFKKQFVGTDKHSYFKLSQSGITESNNKYNCGIYVRFDWRNPNHILTKYPNETINLNPYYYIIEKFVGKQIFFNAFLKKDEVKPIGDKCISQDLIKSYINTHQIKQSVLKLYCSFSYYCQQVGLEIIDGCCMFNHDGSFVWSEINPDCMRVKKIDKQHLRQDYDKDIWRIGGSDSKDKIKQKWNLFNKLLMNYFSENRFHEVQLLQMSPLSYTMNHQAKRILNDASLSLSNQYKDIFTKISSCTQLKKQLIATIDISEGKPTLVKSSQVSQNHSDNSLVTAYDCIKILPQILLVDLDAAMGKSVNNRQSIKQIINKSCDNIYGVGGGIRSKQALQFYLNQLSVPKVILSTNLQLLAELSKDIISNKVIVELSINQENQILTHGRTINTHQNVIKKMIQLTKIGVKFISLTFNQKQGHLSGIPREQFRDIMFQAPGTLEKIIIAGGISSLEDLEYIWGFPKAVPQLGSAIWKGKISVSDIYCQILHFDERGLCPAILTDSNGQLLGEIFMNKQSIKLTCQTRELYRYSRKLQRLIKKGQMSGNTQRVISMKPDCDSDCLNIILEANNHPFCHLNCRSCFGHSTNGITDIQALQDHILQKKFTGSGYSKRLQQNEGLAMGKFIEEAQQFQLTKNNFVSEGADVLAHMLMFLNAKNIKISQIMRQLDQRSRLTKVPHENSNKSAENVYKLGVMGGKHFYRIDQVIKNLLGIKIIRPNTRSLKLEYQIIDPQRYQQNFHQKTVKLIGIKSKDMSSVLQKKYISGCFNYSIMMENSPKVWIQHQKQLIKEIKLVLLKQKDKQINPKTWTKHNKGKIVSEYPGSLINYMTNEGIDESCYSIIKVSGGTEAFLQDQFDYCDAIMQTGKTIQENNLQIVAIICDAIYGGFYTLIE